MKKNILKDLIWAFLEKGLRLIIGTTLTLMLAKQMGPNEFGTFSSIFAVFMLVSGLAGLGLKDIVIDEIANGRSNKNTIVSSAAGLMFLAGAAIALIFLVLYAYIFTINSVEFKIAVFLSIVLLLKGFDSLFFALEAETNIIAIAVAQKISLFTGVAIKSIVLFFGATAMSLSVSTAFELIALYISVICFASKNNIIIKSENISTRNAFNLLERSWPLMVSSIAVIGYFYIDQILISILMDSTAVGIYATATRISQQFYIIPMLLVTAFIPRLTAVSTKSKEDFVKGFTALTVVLLFISLLACVLVYIFADSFLYIFLGAQFSEAVNILKLHILGLVLVSISILSGRWYVMQGLQHLTMYRQLLTVFINICLNMILIPLFGLNGGVISALISLFFLAFVFDLLNSETKELTTIKKNAFIDLMQPRKIMAALKILKTI